MTPNVEALDCILKDADVVLATLEEAAALVDAGAGGDGGNGAVEAGHGAPSEEQRSVPGFLSPVVPN